MPLAADTIDENTSNAKVYGYTIILGIGVGSYCQSGFSVAQMKAGPSAAEITFSVGFMTVAQMLGIAIGTGMSGAIFINTAEQGLRSLFPHASAADISAAVAGIGSGLISSAGPVVEAEAVHAIARSIELAFLPVVAAGAGALLCSLTMKCERVFP